jgi:hypothetical protein
MMSFQEIAFCYIIMMLATPVIVYLLVMLKGQKKFQEVKPDQSTFKLKQGPNGLCNPETFKEEAYKEFLSFQALDVIRQIKYIQENPANINWEEWEEDTEEEKELNAKASGVLSAPSTPSEEDLLYRIQEELEITSHVLLRKPMRKRKKNFGKSVKNQNRIIKPEWVR